MTNVRRSWHRNSPGRYSRLARPVAHRRTAALAERRTETSNVDLHSQTLMFMLVAVLVGVGLLVIVPRLSAAGAGISSSSQKPVITSGVRLEDQEKSSIVNTQSFQQREPGSENSESQSRPREGIAPIFTSEVRFWESKIMEWSKLYNLDPDIIATIMQIESCGDPGAASHAGAQGLFQVMPFHFEPGEDMLDPDTNARRGMAFYNRQLEYTGWDIYLSFAGYNGGYAASGSSYAYWAAETQRYYAWAKGIYDDAKAGLTESPSLEQWLNAGGGGGCQRAAVRLGI